MTTFANGATVSDTVTIASLASLGAGAYSAPSSLIDNTPAGPHGVSYVRGLIRLSFSGALTAGSGNPSIVLYRHVAADGTNLPSPPGSSAISPLITAAQNTATLNASANFQTLDFGPFDMDAFPYGFQFYNNSGVNFSGTATVTLVRGSLTGQ